MIEHEILKLQIVSSLKLIIVGYLFFFWIPKRVLPQDYIDNSLDRIMFNIIHMVAIITLVFPLFIYMRVFGVPFLVIFFIVMKLLFIRFYFKQNLQYYFKNLFNNLVFGTLRFLENPHVYLAHYRIIAQQKVNIIKANLNLPAVLYFFMLSSLLSYSLYLRIYRSYISLVGAVDDMYVFYYWNNILKLNILFDKVAAAPYMWGGPVLVYTINILARLNTIVLYNIFHLLTLSFIFFTIYYFMKKICDAENIKTSSVFIAFLVFGILLPSPVASHYFGTVIKTEFPLLKDFGLFAFYYDVHPGLGKIEESYPFMLYWRLTTTLPYELAASFFLISLYSLIKLLQSQKTKYFFLYGEILAIILAIHGGVAISLFFPSLFIFLYAVVTARINVQTMRKVSIAVFFAGIIGNLWMMQFFIYGIPQDIGAAAPILDKIFKTERAYSEMQTMGIYTVQLVTPTVWLFVLIFFSFGLVIWSVWDKKIGFSLASPGLMALGILSIYFAQNIGLPRIIDHSRLQVFIAYAYAIVFGILYFYIIERRLLKLLFHKKFFQVSLVITTIISIITILETPRWIDNQRFWKAIARIEYNEIPYLVNKIEDEFEPFTYVIVSYVQQFPQTLSSGYHENTQVFLQKYVPSDPTLPIAAEYIFLFVENEPKEYMGLGEYWYRWRRDIMLKLKDWIIIYSQNHDNIKLWHSSKWVNICVIDNRAYQDLLYKQREQLKQIRR